MVSTKKLKTVPLFSLVKNKTDIESIQIRSSRDIDAFARNLYNVDLEIYESFFIVCLNRANRTVGVSKISQGGITGTVVDIKLIAKYALDSLASGVILIHNHPSGQLSPSSADLNLTKNVKAGLKLLEIDVLDHIILTEDAYFSFADEGIV
jgi:DNA repair protein RadC